MKKHLIVLDFLYQKYEIEYEENMLPQDVIRKVQHYLFPCEQNDDYFSSQNEKSFTKFGLYRSDGPDFIGAKFVKEIITPEQCDYNKHQFYIFRPFINVYLTIYVVLPGKLDKHQCKARLKLIYPIKKKVKLLKNFLKDNLSHLTKDKEQFKDCPINGFSLQFTPDSKYKSYELTDEEYIEQSMNGEELFLIINSDNTISQNFFMPGRFYYIHFDPSSNQFSKETESLDETKGFTLDDTRKKLIRKHLEGKNFLEENVLITFNSVLQTDKFGKLDDLFCDNDFYKFVVIFETSEININPIPETFQYIEKKEYDIPIPKNGRPNVIKFRIKGEPKPELTQINSSHSNKNSLNQTTEETNPVNNNNNNNNHHNTLATDENNINKYSPETNPVQTKTHEIIHNNEENVEPSIEEEEINENEDIKNEDDEEKILDMFCFYFSRFSKEKQLSEKKTPNPTYFKNLSNDEINLLNTFKKYYHFYRQSNH